MSKLLEGKRGLIMGVANDRSMAWGIAKACAEQGAELAFSYQGEALEKRVRPLAAEVGSDFLIECDVSDNASIDNLAAEIEKRWGKIDFFLHAVGYSDKSELRGRFVDTSLDNFLMTMNISAFSFVSVAQRLEKMMTDGGSMLTLTYYGAEKVVPHYNVMGVAKAALEACTRYMARDLGEKDIRVNAISAGPMKTLAASGVGDFRMLLKYNEKNAPLKRNITLEDVAGAGLYLLSGLSSGVTGEIHYVDAGFNITGMPLDEESMRIICQ
ncbi:enoyl-ACP reductase FabI [Gimibacter soli]|uniref:Enoyl-[acyl-carrier-protein] reductase [NADH] n=1 Tax=Gimibacter soli TaxID=3024400 RepID=A0AAE9XPG5_9PROT|nr:SDR family oxidoreductase [Gimibacter soli]WCL52641.1 SDR family oxidoreductase [Gimibacter soli]